MFHYMTKYGLPDESCMLYSATDHTKFKGACRSSPLPVRRCFFSPLHLPRGHRGGFGCLWVPRFWPGFKYEGFMAISIRNSELQACGFDATWAVAGCRCRVLPR